MNRTVNVFIGIGFQMVITMVAHPRNRIAGERHRGASGENELQPTRHLESAMGQIAVQIKGGTDPAPQIHEQDNRKVSPLEPSPERRDPQQLKSHENDEKKNVKFIVFEHGAQRERTPDSGGSRVGDEARCNRMKSRARLFFARGPS